MIYWLFKVSKVLYAKPVTYRLRDMKDEKILDNVYKYELQKVKTNRIYQIEKVLKSRSYRDKRQLIISWLG